MRQLFSVPYCMEAKLGSNFFYKQYAPRSPACTPCRATIADGRGLFAAITTGHQKSWSLHLHYISKPIPYSCCKTDLRTCNTFSESWKSPAMNCAAWHHTIYKGITEAGIMRGLLAVESRDRKRRALASLATQASQFICITSNSDGPSGHSRWCQDLINS